MTGYTSQKILSYLEASYFNIEYVIFAMHLKYMPHGFFFLSWVLMDTKVEQPIPSLFMFSGVTVGHGIVIR